MRQRMASKLETDPVIMINERNSQTTTREKYILLKLKKDHTIIIFSALDKTSDICGQHIFIEDGNMIMNKNEENNSNYK